MDGPHPAARGLGLTNRPESGGGRRAGAKEATRLELDPGVPIGLRFAKGDRTPTLLGVAASWG